MVKSAGKITLAELQRVDLKKVKLGIRRWFLGDYCGKSSNQ